MVKIIPFVSYVFLCSCLLSEVYQKNRNFKFWHFIEIKFWHFIENSLKVKFIIIDCCRMLLCAIHFTQQPIKLSFTFFKQSN